ncbi:hypothetical protein L3Y34_018529 [Caenorhabditis briggsae]|uniref:Uncharacterized protein n=1 Tax=Caenorhabditis briggsae TaxID=6238 RepID=A0AAE9DMH7_CAEBR|nr:hypothetical protein L3Y34_018529 [Caenorhabditis briggsae]
MSHVFKFVDSPPKSSSDFSDFTQVCSKLAAFVKSEATKVEGLKTKLSNLKDDKYTKYLMEFNEYNVTQEFQRFGRFQDVFKQGDVMEKEIRDLDYKNANRRGWIEKMNIFQSVKSKFFEMKAEILKRRGFYTPESIENLMSLRWLVENLADIPIQSFNITAADGFVASLTPIFDLNFAAHQEKCSIAYASFKALLIFANKFWLLKKSHN